MKVCISFLAAGLLAGFVLTYHIPGNKPRLKSEVRVGNEAGLSRLPRKKRDTSDTRNDKSCPGEIPNGDVRDCARTVGSTCKYYCNAFHQQNSSIPNLTCQPSLNWNVDPRWLCPRKGAYACINDRIPHVEIEAGCRESYRRWCSFACEAGYNNQYEYSVNRLYCPSTGIWTPSLYGDSAATRDTICLPKVCPSTIPNGNLASSCSSAYGSTCNYTCNDGYEHNIRASNISCVLMEWSSEHNVKWNVDVHSLCTNSHQCTFEIPGVKLDVSCLRNVGDTCSYECTYGLSPTSDTITCEQSSTWNKAESSLCETTQCPDTIPNGYIPPTCERYIGSRCDDYQCNANYTLSGRRRALRCSDSGTWKPADDFHYWFDDPMTSDLQYYCTLKLPVKLCPDEIANGYLTLACEGTIGSTCTYGCNDFHEKNRSVPYITCQPSTNWSVDPLLLCPLKQCLAEIPNGNVSSTCDRYIGSTCEYECDYGYQQNSSISSITCQQSTHWNVDLHYVCPPKHCPDSIRNGSVWACGNTVGCTCDYVCNANYQKNSSIANITCQPSTKWSIDTDWLCPRKGAYACINDRIPHVNIESRCRESYTLWCRFDCDAGYHKPYGHGVPFLHCPSTGKWEPYPSTRNALHATRDTLCIPKLCQTTIPNGKLSRVCTAANGCNCTYTCNDGYEQNNEVLNIACRQENRRWEYYITPEYELPVGWSVDPHSLCTNNKQCTYEIPFADLDLSCSRNVGDTCKYVCYLGYSSPSGNRSCGPYSASSDECPNTYIPASGTITCKSSLNWDKPASSLCKRTLCPETIQNGHIPSTCKRKVHSVCQEYQCNSNYTRPVSTSGLRCTLSGKWVWNHYKQSVYHYFCIEDKGLCPAYIKNGMIEPECFRAPGDKCVYNCNIDSKHSMVNYVTCQEDGYWNHNTDELCADSWWHV